MYSFYIVIGAFKALKNQFDVTQLFCLGLAPFSELYILCPVQHCVL